MIEKANYLSTNQNPLGTIANAVKSLKLKVSKDLCSCGTYKVKIKRYRFKNSSTNETTKRNLILNRKSISFDATLKTTSATDLNDDNYPGDDNFLANHKGFSDLNTSLSSNSVLLSIVSNASLADTQNQQNNLQVHMASFKNSRTFCVLNSIVAYISLLDCQTKPIYVFCS
jgi:hypothetical protein